MTQELMDTLFPGLIHEQDWHISGMLAPYLGGTSTPQQPVSLHPNDKGAYTHIPQP